ncbi:hypothetical protein SAMN05660816_02952 [Niastella yeongjuensis]|nr:hypothetical protein SAMN05660816_02952 [Niastella yeongjuensis]
MLRTETVDARTLDLIKKFMSGNNFKELNLVGGRYKPCIKNWPSNLYRY